ncbi:hypothetical protein RB2150_18372 [Rhodobacterales bacterium HTCC2150]|nr:hypothetical protein RB2150_18372 [Rhodobacterales bacterium HTCC2150] [Rhodobacteraceae bacterium HTCC2150]
MVSWRYAEINSRFLGVVALKMKGADRGNMIMLAPPIH